MSCESRRSMSVAALTGAPAGLRVVEQQQLFHNAKDTHMNNQRSAPATPSRQRKSSAIRATKAKGKDVSPKGSAGSEAPASAQARSKQLSKQDQLAALLIRDEGATIAQMMDATGWLPHTLRAALTGLKKKGFAVDSDKVGGIRTYRAVAPQ